VKFSGKVGDEPLNKRLNLGGDPVTFWMQRLLSEFVTIRRCGKWLTDIHSYWFARWRHW